MASHGIENTVYGGMRVEDSYLDEMRKYGKDKKYFQWVAKYQFNDISILRIISDKFDTVPTGILTDFRWDFCHKDEPPWKFSPHADSTQIEGTYKSKISIANGVSAVLHINSLLTVVGLYTDLLGAYLQDARDDNAFLPEAVIVTNVGADDSAGVGYRWVTVNRMHPNLTPAAAILPITTAMTLISCAAIRGENSDPFPAFSVNKGKDFNFVGTYSKSFGISSHVVSGIEQWVETGDPLDEERADAQSSLVKEFERHLMNGRRDMKTIAGLTQYEMGGVFEGIPNTAAHRNWKNFNNVVTPYNLQKFLTEEICETVGSDITEYFWFVGTRLGGAIDQAYDSKVGLSLAESESARYGIKIKELELNNSSMKFYKVPAPILNEFGMSDCGLILNLSQKHRAWQIATKTELHTYPDGDDTLSNKGQRSKVKELFMEKTLARRLPELNFATYGVTIP